MSVDRDRDTRKIQEIQTDSGVFRGRREGGFDLKRSQGGRSETTASTSSKHLEIAGYSICMCHDGQERIRRVSVLCLDKEALVGV